MTRQADRATPLQLGALANACHDMADRYLVRFIETQDLGDQPAADAAWKRYQQYWEAEMLAITADEGKAGELDSDLQRLINDPCIAGELADILGRPIPA
ncbi:MAG: hypothetical protein EXR52_05330 [Dehalococcoidia bacterium]|nr:hypothetical protein [Dehalococcoidia bacterium]